MNFYTATDALLQTHVFHSSKSNLPEVGSSDTGYICIDTNIVYVYRNGEYVTVGSWNGYKVIACEIKQNPFVKNN